MPWDDGIRVWGEDLAGKLADTAEKHISVDQDGKFWFWDEVYAYAYGPFLSIEAARGRMKQYAEEVLG